MLATIAAYLLVACSAHDGDASVPTVWGTSEGASDAPAPLPGPPAQRPRPVLGRAMDTADSGVLADPPTQACQGFQLLGLKYSPGGDTLPDTCKPFHPLTNNPYAIQCAAADPSYATPYPGDAYCILPPPPDKGVQFGVHVLPADSYWARMWAGDFSMYRDRARTGPYELAGRDETIQNYASNAYTHHDRHGHFYRVNFRGRPGSHHVVAKMTRGHVAKPGWAPGESLVDVLSDGGGTLISAQRSYTDVPSETLAIPDGDRGIGFPIEAGAGAAFQLHHFNPADTPVLREFWINVWYVEQDAVTDVGQEAFISAPIDYPRDAVLTNTFAAVAEAPTRLLRLLGHRHAWTPRFSAWIERADGSLGPNLYESFDWYNVPTFTYNSLVDNPKPNPATLTDGGHSGELWLDRGDKVRFRCHVETTAERASALGVPVPGGPLRFANEAYGGEMCILGTWTTNTKLKPLRAEGAPP